MYKVPCAFSTGLRPTERHTAFSRMNFINTHTHLYAEEFDTDREDAYARAQQAGVETLLLPNIDEASIEPMMKLCARHPQHCFPMMGLHPTELPANPQPLLEKMHLLLSHSKQFVAIGEVGIDLYWDSSRREEQIEVFKTQILWAVEFGLPLVIHSRSAHRELMDALLPQADRLPGGIFHCFGGTEEEAEELLRSFPHFVLGIGGVVTFKKSTLPQVLNRKVPIERIVLETDDPYLAPTPHRGSRNEPAYVTEVAEQLAQTYQLPVEKIAEITTENALRIFPKLCGEK